MRHTLRTWLGQLNGTRRRRLGAMAALGLLMVVACGGCGGRATPHYGSQAEVHAGIPGATPTPHAASAPASTVPAEPSSSPPVVHGLASGGRRSAGPLSSGSGGATSLGAGESTAAAFSAGEPATVEELLAEGLHRAGASPVHLAIRGTPAATSVRCAWRGVARTASQREDAIRFWLQLGATDSIPGAAYLETLFAVILDTLDPDFRETAKANFLAIARGGESMDYLFLTCFADYAVTSFLLGTGTTPTTVTVAYDPMGDAASYDLYVREHDTRYVRVGRRCGPAARIRSHPAGAGGGSGKGFE